MRQLPNLLQRLGGLFAHPMNLPLVELIVGVIGLALAGVIGRATQVFHDAFQIDTIGQVIVQVGGDCIIFFLIFFTGAVLFMVLHWTCLKFRVKDVQLLVQEAQEKKKFRDFQDALVTKPEIKASNPESQAIAEDQQPEEIAISPLLEEARAGSRD